MDAQAHDIGCFEGFAVDALRRTLHRGTAQIELRPKSFDVLAYLVRAAGRTVAKGELLEVVWPGVVVTEESLTRCISDIRAALSDREQRIIKTVPRQGYVLAAPVRFEAASMREPALAKAAPTRWHLRARGARWLLAGGGALAIAAAVFTGWPRATDTPPLSIVVLPLAALDPEQAYLAEGLTEDLTTDLSRIPGSLVIARSSAVAVYGRGRDVREVGAELGVRYALEGSAQRVGEQVRLNVRLIDTQSRRELWAERFDADRTDIASLQRRVTGTLARSLHLQLIEAESQRGRLRANPDAHDLALRAWSAYERRTEGSVATARDLLERSLAADPDSVFSLSLLADTYTADILNRWMHLRAAARVEWMQRAHEAARRAYALDPDNLYAVGALATVVQLQGKPEEGLALLQRQVALNRNYAPAWHRLSYGYVTLGRQDDAIHAGEEALRLSPRDGRLYSFYVVMAAAHLHAGRDAMAVQWARKSAEARPDFGTAYAWLAAAAANAGDMDTAQQAMAQFRRLQPDYTVARFRDERLSTHPDFLRQRERFHDGLLKAGLPA